MSETFKTDDGGTIKLGRELGRGGEGSVYEVEGQPGLCAKIYASTAVNVQLHDKLKVMVAYPPKDPTVETQKHHSIAWPTRLLYRGAADPLYFAGFIMPAIADKDFKKAFCRFHPDGRAKHSGGEFTWRHAYTSALNISSAVAAIHERGYCVGDINESNILVSGNTLVTLIDCDSFQVRDAGTGRMFRCAVGKGEYTAPELAGKVYCEVDRTPATDHFGLAVLLFQFLMEGCHPYQSRGQLVADASSTVDKISLGYFPYRHAGKPAGVEPPTFAPAFDILPAEVQQLFVRAFAQGHKEPSARPTSLEWFSGLRKLHKQVVECKANRRHWYFQQLGDCPWCRITKEKGKDPFPAPGQVRAESLLAQLPLAKIVAPKAGQSILQISNASFWHLWNKDSVPGVKFHDGLIVENAGGVALSGTLSSDQGWLKLSRNSLDANERSQEIGLEIDTRGLNQNLSYTAHVEIKTNGGQATVEVSIGAIHGAAPAGWKFLQSASKKSQLIGAGANGSGLVEREVLLQMAVLAVGIILASYMLITMLK